MTRPVPPLRLVWLTALVLLAGCRGDDRLPVDLPAPCSAVDGPILDSMRDSALAVRRDVFDFISPRYTITNDYIVHSVLIDSSATWGEIMGFYGNEFRYAPLATSGFVNPALASPEPNRYEFILWARPGKRVGLRAPEDEVLVAFYMLPQPGQRYGVLQWAHLYDERIDGNRFSAPPSDLDPVKRRYFSM